MPFLHCESVSRNHLYYYNIPWGLIQFYNLPCIPMEIKCSYTLENWGKSQGICFSSWLVWLNITANNWLYIYSLTLRLIAVLLTYFLTCACPAHLSGFGNCGIGTFDSVKSYLSGRSPIFHAASGRPAWIAVPRTLLSNFRRLCTSTISLSS